jgi:uncharacterized protein (TIGR02466 family)
MAIPALLNRLQVMTRKSQSQTAAQSEDDAQIAALLKDVRGHLAKNDYAAAEHLLDLGLTMRPADTDIIYYFGQLRGRQSRLEEAVSFYRQGLQINPELPEFHFCLGQILSQTGRAAEGAASQREAVRIKPNFAEAYLELGLALSRLENFAEAEKVYRAALRIQPNDMATKQALGATLIVLKRPQEAEAIARQALLQTRGDSGLFAPLAHNLAIALCDQRRYQEALAVFDRVRTAAPGLPLVDYNRGNALLSMGRFGDAAMAFHSAITVNPLDLKAHFGLNQLLYRLGSESFLRSYSDAAALFPSNPMLYTERAKLLFMVERYGEAAEAFSRALELAPDNVMVRHGLASALARLGRFDEAEREFELLMAKEPDDANVVCNYAECSLRAGKPDKAQVLAGQVLARDPHNQLAFALFATALRCLRDDLDPALGDYDSLIQIFDLDPPDGFADMESFNRELDAYLANLHLDGRLPLHHTGPVGTRSMGALFGAGHELAEKLKTRIDEALATYVARLADDATHRFLSRRAPVYRYAGSWSTRLGDGGAHANHVHPRGWISSAYYVAVPDAAQDEQAMQGWLKFGEPPFDCGLSNPVRRFVKPAVGRLVLFPSYLWHGTTPFHSDQTRTAIAFDVVPAARS